jgi:hypothetical protein
VSGALEGYNLTLTLSQPLQCWNVRFRDSSQGTLTLWGAWLKLKLCFKLVDLNASLSLENVVLGGLLGLIVREAKSPNTGDVHRSSVRLWAPVDFNVPVAR